MQFSYKLLCAIRIFGLINFLWPFCCIIFWFKLVYVSTFSVAPTLFSLVFYEAVKSTRSQNTVAHALQYLRLHLSRHPGAFDAHATMAALENLVDTARENADADILRYNAILRQTRGLAENPVLQRVLLKLLGSKEEIAIAKEIDKATKRYPPTPLLRSFQSSA